MDDNQKTFLKQRDSHNKGQYTEKRIHLSSRLPYWLQAVTPRVFYCIEKSWNFFPFTITEYTVRKLHNINEKLQFCYHLA
jgi:Phosphatidylinositol transfer protein